MSAKKKTYNDAIIEIEEILSQIENNEVNVDELSVKVKRVALLLEQCKEKLKKTEIEVEKLIEEIDSE